MGFITKIDSLEEIDAFKVEKTPVFFNDNVRVPDTFSLRRVDDGQHLGIVGSNYRPIQMEEMIDVLDKASARVGYIEHVGYTTSRGGRKVLIQSKLAENINIKVMRLNLISILLLIILVWDQTKHVHLL